MRTCCHSTDFLILLDEIYYLFHSEDSTPFQIITSVLERSNLQWRRRVSLHLFLFWICFSLDLSRLIFAKFNYIKVSL